MSSTDNRIAKAKLELDKAEQQLKSRLSEDQLNNLNAIQKLQNTYSSAFSDYYDDIAKNVKGAGAIFFITEGTNLVVNLSKGQSGIKNAIDVIGSAAVTIASFTPQGRLIMWGNTALSLVGLDVSSVAKKIYDWAMGNDDNTDDYGRKIELVNGVLQVTMSDGTIYARPFMPNAQGSLFGNGKSDVLFGGNDKDIFIGHGGNDIFIGNAGKDDYFVDNGDTIKDSDGKGRVFLSSTNIQLTGGTQIEKGSKIYKGKDGVKYELKGSDLIINDSITIENFNPYADEYLGITLYEADEIAISVSNASAKEKEQSMSFTISLSRNLKENEFIKVTIPKIGNNEAKTYMFIHSSSTDWKVADGIEYIFDSSTTYTYSWSDLEFANLNLLIA